MNEWIMVGAVVGITVVALGGGGLVMSLLSRGSKKKDE